MPGWADVGAEGMSLPEPPASLAAQLQVLGMERWGTRAGTPALRGIGWYVAEATEGRADDYVLAGIEEVATGLSLVHEYLVFGPLAMFVQARTGEAGRATLACAGELQAAAVGPPAGLPSGEGRLIVVDTPLGSSYWQWNGEPSVSGIGGTDEALRWLLAGEVVSSSTSAEP